MRKGGLGGRSWGRELPRPEAEETKGGVGSEGSKEAGVDPLPQVPAGHPRGDTTQLLGSMSLKVSVMPEREGPFLICR